MIYPSILLTLALVVQAPTTPDSTQGSEAKIVEYLKANVKPGEPVVVSKLRNEVFTSEADRKALDRLFNTFFKIPLYVVQVQKGTGKPPTLKEISEQFSFKVPGEADVILRILDSDPRVPKFIKRDPATGEIVTVDMAAIQANARFGKILERTITGWEGNPAPAFTAKAYDGSDVTRAQFQGKPFLLYFWFTNCPPCVRTSPLLVELDKVYGPKGFTIVGLNADKLLELDYTDEVRAAYVEKLGIKFKTAYANAESQVAYGGVSVFPTMFFVDKSGVIVKQLVNGPDKVVLEDAIKLALK